jgi:hypothetical protein
MAILVGTDGGSPPQIRAWLVVKVADYLAPDARARLLDQATPELRTLMERSKGDREGWAPLDLFPRALVAADAISGRGDLSSCWDIGRFTAHDEAGAVRSLALKMLRPASVLGLATSLWQVHYRNAGRAVARVGGDQAMTLSVVGYPSPHRAHCLAVGGWMQGALELGPRRGVRVEEVACRCERATTCEYRVSWQEA